MKRIALSQRIEHIKSYGEFRASLDLRYSEWLFWCGYEPFLLPMTGEPDSYLEKCAGLLLTGGGDLATVADTPENRLRDRYEQKIIDCALKEKLPVFGVCRGLHSLNGYFGGTLKRIQGHVAARHMVSFQNGQPREVNSYHNYVVDRLGKGLEIIAANHAAAEMIAHKTLPIKAVMWHPEREKEFKNEDKKLIAEVFG